MDVEDLLRSHFADQALDSPDPALDLLPRAFARRRARRRRKTVAVAAVAACTAVVVAVIPVVSDLGGPGSVDRVSAPGDDPLSEYPTRGSLSQDTAFVSALVAAPWSSARPEQRQVAFVGDVPGGRWALVVGLRDGVVVGQWFTGMSGATPDQLVADRANPENAGGAAFTHVESTAPTSPLVVVPALDQSVEVSQRAVVDADGTVHRDYQPAPTTDGVAVLELDAQTREGTASAARYRLVSGGTAGPSAPLSASGSGRTFAPPTLTPLRPGSGSPSPEAVDLALAQVGAPTGLEDDELAPQLLWAGPVASGSETVDVAVVVANLPSGALAVSTAWSQIAEDGSGYASTCGTQLFPAGTRIEDLVVVADCADVRGARSSAYVLSVPAGAHQITLSSGNGSTATVSLDDQSVLRTDLPAGVTTARLIGPTGSITIAVAQPSPADVFDRAEG